MIAETAPFVLLANRRAATRAGARALLLDVAISLVDPLRAARALARLFAGPLGAVPRGPRPATTGTPHGDAYAVVPGTVKIALVIGSLAAGGAQRVMTLLADEWAARGRAVTLITFDAPGDPEFFSVHEVVRRRRLDAFRLPSRRVKGANSIRQVVRLRLSLRRTAPDVVISFIASTNVLTLLATRGMHIPVIVSDRLDPHVDPLTRGWRILRRLLYPRATVVVAQTSRALSFYSGSVRRTGRVIPNPVPAPPAADAGVPVPGAPRRLIALGRLHEQKGFDLLLRAFAAVAPRHPGWILEIWGEGPERQGLETLVADLALTAQVRLPGLTRAPHVVLRNADVFVMSSRGEGFPNALAEAMASGVAVVSFDCPSGPSELIRDGIDGLLVAPGDTDALSQALDRLMADGGTRARLAARAPEVLERFSMPRVLAEWDRTIEDAIERS